MKNTFKKSVSYIDLVLFFAFWVYYVFFQHNYWVELPSMSYFEQIELAGLYLNGTMDFADLFSAYSEHGMFGTNLMMLLNIALFDLKTTFDVAVNVGIVAVFGLVCFLKLRESFADCEKDLRYYVAVAACGFFAFNIVQGACSGMDMQVRLGMLFGLFATIAFDKILFGDADRKHLAVFAVITILYINVFGTLYCMATTAVILVVIVMRTITECKWDKAYYSVIVVSIVCWIVYFVEYSTVGESSGAALDGNANSFGSFFETIAFYFQGLLIYSGSFVFGYDTIVDSRVSIGLYLTVGLVILIGIFWAAFRFFMTKQYKKTWLPLMLIGYSYAVFCMLILGRNDYGIEWYASTWYHVHTKTAVIGMIWILAKDAAESKRGYCKNLCVVTCCVMVMLAMVGVIATNLRVPYVKIYLENKQPYLYVVNVEDMPVDTAGMTPLDHDLDMTMKCLQILREHKLSVFSDPENADRVYSSPSEQLKDRELYCLQGTWEDLWMTNYAEIAIKTGDETETVLRAYYPFEVSGDQIIKVSIGDVVKDYLIESESIEIPLTLPADQLMKIKLESNFSFVNDPDNRALCFIFMGIDGFTITN